MNKTLITQISDCIEKSFSIEGKNYSKRIIVFPVGEVGIKTIDVMKNVYGIEPAFLVDNHKCKFSDTIDDSSLFKRINAKDYVVILASTTPELYTTLRRVVQYYFPPQNIIELDGSLEKQLENSFKTKIGKYCYGPICRNHRLIESIGSFCSFAEGVEVVSNHEMNYLSTHPFLCAGVNYTGITISYENFKSESWYFQGVKPKPIVEKKGRSVIGNDVWLGRNVIITNYANIGNGVIAAAGAVITKDIPDYAVVAGVPARIIRYRYTPEQIKALDEIAWWAWTDDEIRDRYDDFYLPIDAFIQKYKGINNTLYA